LTKKKRVKQYFIDTEQDPKKAPWVFARYALILVLLLVFYYLQFFNEFVKGNRVLLPLVVTGFGFILASVNIHLVHDGCHGSVTHNPKVWDAMAHFHDMISGCSSVNWFYQHVLGHHIYTNIDGADPDIEVKDVDFRRIRPWVCAPPPIIYVLTNVRLSKNTCGYTQNSIYMRQSFTAA
jgi:acyl-lipid (8-3)-desaturase